MLRSVYFWCFAAVLFWLVACVAVAMKIAWRKGKTIPLKTLAFKTTDIELFAADGSRVSAWFIKGNSEKSVIILPGIGGDRRYSVARAGDYFKKGYSVLLPDLRATGRSDGNIISFGWHESKDLIACYRYLKEMGFKRPGVHGISLGAATIVYSLKECTDWSFIILESCYDNIDNAYTNRMNRFPLASTLFFPVKSVVQAMIGVGADSLRPQDYICKADCPVLMMAGDSESQLKLEETRTVFNNCTSSSKYLHIFKDGKHEDFRVRFPEEYNKVFESFIQNFE
jgi:uncharacterized protein